MKKPTYDELVSALRDLHEQVSILLPFLDKRPVDVIRANDKALAALAKVSGP